MHSNVCKVCGGGDMNLLDGFYYCVECGTQDENVQERVVDTENYVGLSTKISKSRVRKVKEKVSMSPEWCKWHAFNFIIAGLADELIAAGAEPSVKTKILWIWTRYMKRYRVKEEGLKSHFLDTKSNDMDNEILEEQDEKMKDIQKTSQNDKEMEQNSDIEGGNSDYSNEEDDESDDDLRTMTKTERLKRMESLIENFSKGVIIAIFYLALNLDKSFIQLSHLLRYVMWNYVDISTCMKYVPKDLNVKIIPKFGIFRVSLSKVYHSCTIRRTVWSLIRFLDLGLPLVPDLRKIVDDTSKELCLPNDLKQFVLALMYQYPSRYIKVSKRFDKIISLPDYELIVLSYFVFALKLCFGLDDQYEIKMSDAVDKINADKNYPKSFSFGASSDPTERLFSFKEWCAHIRLRRMIVCQHNLDMARLFKYDVDDHIFVEHIDKISEKPLSLTDDIVKTILNKIPLITEMPVIPKGEFDIRFTPMASCVMVILDYIQDPDVRLLLSEDFTQYSLEYALRKLQLKENDDSKNLIKGIDKDNKCINKNITGEFNVNDDNLCKMLYVRFCESKDDVLKQVEANKSGYEKDIVHDDNYINNSRTSTDAEMNSASKNNNNNVQSPTKENMAKEDILDQSKDFEKYDNNQRTITFVDYPNAAIYDDDNKDDVKMLNESMDAFDNSKYFEEYAESYLSNAGDKSLVDDVNPGNIDRKALINELVTHACQKYKISLPPVKQKPRNNQETKRERKAKAPKKQRIMPVAKILFGGYKSKREATVYQLLSTYYQNTQENNSPKNIENDDGTSAQIENNLNNIDVTENENDVNSIGKADPLNDTDDCQVQEDEGVNNELEALINSSDEESDDEYILPEPVRLDDNGPDAVDIDKAAKKILDKETSRCGAPPRKKMRKDINYTEKPVTLQKDRRFLHPSAWGIKEFSYWTRQYSVDTSVYNSAEWHDRFNLELYNNFPKNFVHVMHMCASVIDCSPFRLYKHLHDLELAILKDVTRNARKLSKKRKVSK